MRSENARLRDELARAGSENELTTTLETLRRVGKDTDEWQKAWKIAHRHLPRLLKVLNIELSYRCQKTATARRWTGPRGLSLALEYLQSPAAAPYTVCALGEPDSPFIPALVDLERDYPRGVPLASMTAAVAFLRHGYARHPDAYLDLVVHPVIDRQQAFASARREPTLFDIDRIEQVLAHGTEIDRWESQHPAIAGYGRVEGAWFAWLIDPDLKVVCVADWIHHWDDSIIEALFTEVVRSRRPADVTEADFVWTYKSVSPYRCREASTSGTLSVRFLLWAIENVRKGSADNRRIDRTTLLDKLDISVTGNEDSQYIDEKTKNELEVQLAEIVIEAGELMSAIADKVGQS
ncbi:hypothetical protein IAU60_006935 [Kwoniella sp. DSM 27419]